MGEGGGGCRCEHQQSATAILSSTAARPLHINLADIRHSVIALYVVKTVVFRDDDMQAILFKPVVGATRIPDVGVEREVGSVSPDKVAFLHHVSSSHPGPLTLD